MSVILLALAADPQPPSELLPPTPPEWRFERINFPLSFAPELKYEGFEELRFAPGMFKADSDTYFTYVFAMKITNEDAVLDAASLQSILETYYRGLCRAVAKDKKFDIDVSKISAQVRVEPSKAVQIHRFRATVESFDPFVTGKPLTLNMEMLVIDVGKTDHRLFAAVSPKPADAPAWALMRTWMGQFQERCSQDSK